MSRKLDFDEKRKQMMVNMGLMQEKDADVPVKVDDDLDYDNMSPLELIQDCKRSCDGILKHLGEEPDEFPTDTYEPVRADDIRSLQQVEAESSVDECDRFIELLDDDDEAYKMFHSEDAKQEGLASVGMIGLCDWVTINTEFKWMHPIGRFGFWFLAPSPARLIMIGVFFTTTFFMLALHMTKPSNQPEIQFMVSLVIGATAGVFVQAIIAFFLCFIVQLIAGDREPALNFTLKLYKDNNVDQNKLNECISSINLNNFTMKAAHSWWTFPLVGIGSLFLLPFIHDLNLCAWYGSYFLSTILIYILLGLFSRIARGMGKKAVQELGQYSGVYIEAVYSYESTAPLMIYDSKKNQGYPYDWFMKQHLFMLFRRGMLRYLKGMKRHHEMVAATSQAI